MTFMGSTKVLKSIPDLTPISLHRFGSGNFRSDFTFFYATFQPPESPCSRTPNFSPQFSFLSCSRCGCNCDVLYRSQTLINLQRRLIALLWLLDLRDPRPPTPAA